MTKDELIEKIIGYGYEVIKQQETIITFAKNYKDLYINNIRVNLEVYFENGTEFKDYYRDIDCSEINPGDAKDLKFCSKIFDDAGRDCQEVENILDALIYKGMM